MALLERDACLSDLHASLDRAIDGQGQLVFLGGEAGIGKSSVIARFVADTAPRARAVVVSCDVDGLPGPLGPLFDIAAALGPEVEALLHSQAPRTAIFRAVLQALRAADTPLVLIGEDAHWTDEATLELVRFLGRRIGGTRVLVIVSYRDDELGAYHPLRRVLGDLASAPDVRRVHLPPLSLAAVTALSRGAAIDPEALFARTGGNPFFVTEAIESGANDVPASVRDAVLARASRLSPEGRSVLDAAAICGLTIDPRLLAAVIGDAMASAVDECLDVGMLNHVDGMVTFRHAISRDAMLSTMSLPRRRALHRRVLDAMQHDPELARDMPLLAYHAEEAGEAEAALTYATAAARRAAAFGAHREAAAQFERALRHASRLPLDERLPLMEAQSYECYLTGNLALAFAVREEVVALCAAAGGKGMPRAGSRGSPGLPAARRRPIATRRRPLTCSPRCRRGQSWPWRAAISRNCAC